MTQDLGSMYVNIGANSSGLSSGLAGATSMISSFGRSLSSIALVGGVAFAGLGVAVGLLTKGIVEVSQIGMELESQMVGVRKTTGMTAEEVKELERRFRGLATEMPVSVNKLAEIGVVAGQLGIQGADNIESFTKTIAMATIALDSFEGNAEEVAIGTATMLNQFQLGIDQTEKLLSSMNALANSTASNERQILSFVNSFTGARVLNITADQSQALGATFAALGQDASAAGTRLERAFIEMFEASDEGGKSIQDLSNKLEIAKQKLIEAEASEKTKTSTLMSLNAQIEKYNREIMETTANTGDATKGIGLAAKTAGMTVEEFAKLGETPIEAMIAVLEGLENIEGSVERNQIAAKIFGQVGARALKPLIGYTDMLRINMETSSKAYEEGLSLQQEFDIASQSTSALLQVLKNNFGELALSMWDQMGMTILELVKMLTNDFIPAIKPLIEILGNVMKSSVSGFTSAIEMLIPFLVDMFPIFESIFNILSDVGLSVFETLAGILVEVGQAVERILPHLLPIFDMFVGLVDKGVILGAMFVEQLIPAIERMIPTYEKIYPMLLSLADILMNLAFDIMEELVPVIEGLMPVMEELYDIIIPLIPPIAELVLTVVKLAATLLKYLLPIVAEVISWFEVFVEPIQEAVNWITLIVEWIDKLIGKLGELTAGKVGEALEWIGGAIGSTIGRLASPTGGTVEETGAIGKFGGSKTVNQYNTIYTQYLQESGDDIALRLKGAGG